MNESVYVLASSLSTWLLSHFYYRKKHKADLEGVLMKRLDDLSFKYLELNNKYINLEDEVVILRRENKRLRNQITCLKKGKR